MKTKGNILYKGKVLGLALLGLVIINKNVAHAVMIAQKPEVIQHLYIENKILIGIICAKQLIAPVVESESPGIKMGLKEDNFVESVDSWTNDLSVSIKKIPRDLKNTDSISFALKSLSELQETIKNQPTITNNLNGQEVASYETSLQNVANRLKALIEQSDDIERRLQDYENLAKKYEKIKDIQKIANRLSASHYNKLLQELLRLSNVKSTTCEDFMENWAYLLAIAGNTSLWVGCEDSNHIPGSLQLQIRRVVAYMGYAFNDIIKLFTSKQFSNFKQVGDDDWINMLSQFQQESNSGNFTHSPFHFANNPDERVNLLKTLFSSELMKLLHQCQNIQGPVFTLDNLKNIDQEFLPNSRFSEHLDSDDSEFRSGSGHFLQVKKVSGQKRKSLAANEEHSDYEPSEEELSSDFDVDEKRPSDKHAGSSRGPISTKRGIKKSGQQAGSIKQPPTIYMKRKIDRKNTLCNWSAHWKSLEYGVLLAALKNQLKSLEESSDIPSKKDILEFINYFNFNNKKKQSKKGSPEDCDVLKNFSRFSSNVKFLVWIEISKCIASNPRNFSETFLREFTKKSEIYCHLFETHLNDNFSELMKAIELYKESIETLGSVSIVSICCEKTKFIPESELQRREDYLKLRLLSLYVLLKAQENQQD